jgi:BlaI family penicillinase repressor
MARRASKNLTERELEIMHVLWSLGQARLGEIQEALNKRSGEAVAPSTVSTQLNLLIAKGYVNQSGRFGRSLYAPSYSRAEATRDLFDDFLTRVGLGGRAPAFLIQLLKEESLTDDDRAALENILRESKPETPGKPTRKEKHS